MSTSKILPPVPPATPDVAMSRASFDRPRPRLTRRRLILLAGVGTVAISAELAATAIRRSGRPRPVAKVDADTYEQIVPEQGIDTGVTFEDALKKLIAASALGPEKPRAQGRAPPDWVERLLARPPVEPIVFTRERAPYLANLLWPIGLSNRVAFNRQSPINTDNLSGFASTVGWMLGRLRAEGVCLLRCRRCRPADRSPGVSRLGDCDQNVPPVLFQDCDHGSALLGLIELSVSQGKAADAVYRIAVAANSYWFPEQYARTAQYFSLFENRPWQRVSAPRVLGASFSTLSGWKHHIDAPLWKAKVLPAVNPKAQPEAACGL